MMPEKQRLPSFDEIKKEVDGGRWGAPTPGASPSPTPQRPAPPTNRAQSLVQALIQGLFGGDTPERNVLGGQGVDQTNPDEIIRKRIQMNQIMAGK